MRSPFSPPVSSAPRRSALPAALLALLLLLPRGGEAANPCDGCPSASKGGAAAPVKVAAAPAAEKAAAPSPAAAADPLADLARSKKRVVIADFGQGLCKQCKKQGAILEEVKKAYGDKVEVRFVHVAKESALAERYGVNMIPHLVYIDPTGKACQADTGVSSFEKIADRLAKLGVRR